MAAYLRGSTASSASVLGEARVHALEDVVDVVFRDGGDVRGDLELVVGQRLGQVALAVDRVVQLVDHAPALALETPDLVFELRVLFLVHVLEHLQAALQVLQLLLELLYVNAAYSETAVACWPLN